MAYCDDILTMNFGPNMKNVINHVSLLRKDNISKNYLVNLYSKSAADKRGKKVSFCGEVNISLYTKRKTYNFELLLQV